MLNNPNALYIFCDGAMDYDSQNTGGVGYSITFPDFVDLEDICEAHGKYVGANIERLELEGLLKGMEAVEDLYKTEKQKLKNINAIIFITDRLGLSDPERTNPYKIQEWRRNSWQNYEGKPIKNHDLLDKLDKKRKKLGSITFCRVSIEWRPRKQNKVADKLSKKGKKMPGANKKISVKGLKVGKRKFGGIEVEYKRLKEKEELWIHIFLKTPVQDQWEISAEICEGSMVGSKIKIYSDDTLSIKLQRRNKYKVRLKKIHTHHVTIYRTFMKLKKEK